MIKKQRKNLMITSPVVFSLCFFSTPFLGAVSFKELLVDTQQPLVVEEDKKNLDTIFTAKLETISLAFPSVILSFPVLSETDSTIKKEFLCGDISIPLSFLTQPILYKDRPLMGGKGSELSESLLKIVASNAAIFSVEKETSLLPSILHQVEEHPSLSDILSTPLHEISLRQESNDTKLNLTENTYSQESIESLGSLVPYADEEAMNLSDKIPLLQKHAIQMPLKTSVTTFCDEERPSIKKPYLAAKESSEVLLPFSFSILTSSQEEESSSPSFNPHDAEPVSTWINNKSTPSEPLSALPRISHLEMASAPKIKNNLLEEKSYSVKKQHLAIKEASEYPLTLKLNSTLAHKDDAEFSIASFNYRNAEATSRYIYGTSNPSISLATLPRTSHLQIASIIKGGYKLLNEEKRSFEKHSFAVKETTEVLLPSALNETRLASIEDKENSTLSFNYPNVEPTCKWIHDQIAPVSIATLAHTTHLQISSVVKSEHKFFSEDIKFAKRGPRPSLEPYLEYAATNAPFIPGTTAAIENTSIAFNNSFSLEKFLINYTHKIPFQGDKGFLLYDISMDDFLISYIADKAPTPHTIIASSLGTSSKRFTPNNQETHFKYDNHLSYDVVYELPDALESTIAFIEPSLDTHPLHFKEEESLVKHNLFFLLEDRMVNSSLIAQLGDIHPKKLSLLTETIVSTPLSPDKELLCVIEINSYPFLQNFYDTIATEDRSFIFPLKITPNPLIASSFTFDERDERILFDNSSSLEEAFTFLEALGDQQSFACSCFNNQMPLPLKADKEMLFAINANTAIYPHPESLIVSYDLTKDLTSFLPTSSQGYLPYLHRIPIDIAKYPICPNYCALLFDNTILNTQFAVSSSLHQDISTQLSYIKPRNETPCLVAYQEIFEPQIHQDNFVIERGALIPTKSPKLLSELNPIPSLVASSVDLCPSRKNAAALNQSSRSTQENLAQLPTLQDLRTLSLSEEFTINLEVTPNTKEKGYLFSITLEPVANKLTSGSAQNFVFLVDRSSSIDKNRFLTFKQAIGKSLLYLKEEDTFNILTFDTEISKMSHDSVYVNASTKLGAKRFLETQKRGYKFVTPNLYHILLSVHQMTKNSDLPTTVVLLTSGKTLENFDPQDEYLSRFISTNHNGFTLFTACSSQTNDTLMLEVLSHLNKGEFMHSQTNAAFPRKLASFVKHAGYLLAKDIHISAAKTNPDVNIEFFPEVDVAPNLYGDRPYTIIGKVDKLSDFDLVLQGRFSDNWLNITKKVSFKNARNGGHSIYKDYTMHMAYNKYRTFLKDGNTASLDEAKKIFGPFTSSIN